MQTAWGCKGCQVNLCSWECFVAFDHTTCQPTRALTVQYAREVPGSRVGPPTERVQSVARSGPAVEGGDFRGRASSPAADGPPYRKPRGYAPAGKQWDAMRGQWVAAAPAAAEPPASAGASTSQQSRRRSWRQVIDDDSDGDSREARRGQRGIADSDSDD